MFSPKYNKNLTGAEITFQPEDINLYSEDPFDVQITIGNSPLEDGYYFTVKDPKLKDLTVRQLLTNYALNIEKRFELDIERYPEFLNYQEELLRYFELSEAGKLSLDIYVNKCNQAVPLDLNVSARNYLSTCVFKDQSFDYCLLDLVFDVNSSRLSSSELDLLIKEYGPIWVLFWLGNEEGIVSTEINEKDYPVISYICELLIEENLISKSFDSKHAKYTLTNSGKKNLSAFQKEADLVISKYAAFESVSIYPPALGVPLTTQTGPRRSCEPAIRAPPFHSSEESLGRILQCCTWVYRRRPEWAAREPPRGSWPGRGAGRPPSLQRTPNRGDQ